MKIIGVDHVSYTVSDLDRSLEFYVGLLGYEIIWRREITDPYFGRIVGFPDCIVKGAQLRIPRSQHRLELFQYVKPKGVRVDVPPNNTCSSHVCLRVEKLVSAYEEMKARGVQFLSPPVLIDAGPSTGGYALYMLDPDGIIIELFQAPEAPVT